MYSSQYYTCEQIDQRLLQGYLDDYNSQNNTNLTKAQFLALLFNTIGRNSTIDNLVTQIGYYECDTAAGTVAKLVTAANYTLFAGGSMKVKFANKNTANNATLNINNQGAKALYYQGERASATNSWDANEVVEIYYDGTSYYANNVNGGSGSGVYDVSKEHPTSGPNGDGKFTLEYILNLSNVNELIPVNKRYPGMSIQFVHTSDNKYVQYRLMSDTFNTTPANWQGVDETLTSNSHNLVESGIVDKYIHYLTSTKIDSLIDIKNDIELVDGLILRDGSIYIGSDPHNKHTSPILLKIGQSLIYKGYSFRTFNVMIFNKVESDGTFISPIEHILKKGISNSDFSREYVSIYTATEQCYVSVNVYDVDWDLSVASIGTLFDLWSYLLSLANQMAPSIQGLKTNATISNFKFSAGRYLSVTGTFEYNSDIKYHADPNFYPIPNFIFSDKIRLGNNLSMVAFYSEENEASFISAISNSDSTYRTLNLTSSDYPANARYVRFCYYDSELEAPLITLSYNPNNEYFKKEIVRVESYITTIDHLIDYLSDGRDLFINGGYIDMGGNLRSNADYSHTDFLEIPVIKTINLISCQTGNSYMAAIAFYDANKTFISALQNLTSTQIGNAAITSEQIPANIRYIRVSGKKNVDGSSTPSLIDYKVTLDEEIAKLDTSLQNIDNRVTTLETSEGDAKAIRFKSFEGSDSLSPNEVLVLLSNKVRVDTLLTAYIEGTINDVEVGVGYSGNSSFKYRTYDARWIELTQTQVKLYGYYNGDYVLHNTYNHGLTLTSKTTIFVITTLVGNNNDSTSTLVISTDDGSTWTQELPSWGQGAAFANNKNLSGSIIVNLKFQPRNITKNVWVFGDSYFSHTISYLYQLGFSKWLRNSQPGSSPEAGYAELQNLLSLGYRPSYVVWCLGMNGNTSESKVDGHYVINSYQKTYIDNVKALCESYNITPVFACIPSVPTRQKTGFRDYIINLGVQYIDFYESVEADEYGIWHSKPTLRAWANGSEKIFTQIYGDNHGFIAINDNTFDENGNITDYKVTAVGESNSSITVNGLIYNRDSGNDISGLLSSDGVHPTSTGGKVLAYAMIKYFPEISICE